MSLSSILINPRGINLDNLNDTSGFSGFLGGNNHFSNLNGFVSGNNAFSNALGDMFSDIYSWANNALTGDRDYRRSQDMLSAENAFTQSQNEADKAFNSAEAEKNRQFQEHTAKNQILWTAQQLRELGLNPYAILSGNNAQGLSGATAYSNSRGSGSAPYMQSGQQITQLLSGVLQSAFRLAGMSMMSNSRLMGDIIRSQPHSYSDTYVDKNGMIAGGRWRDYR